jgi:hypothetical protein
MALDVYLPMKPHLVVLLRGQPQALDTIIATEQQSFEALITDADVFASILISSRRSSPQSAQIIR